MGASKKTKRIARAEHELTGAAAEQRERRIVALLGGASEIADQPPLIAISLVTIGAGVAMRRAALVRTGARMLLAHALATGGKTLLKRTIDRTRPRRALAEGRHRSGKNKGSRDPELNSFPSGHMAGAVGVVQAVAATNPALAAPLRAAAAGIGAMQLPYGKHYPSDVLAGAAIGWVAEKIAGIIVETGERALRAAREQRAERRALEEAAAHPS